jgi:hypothetical protein
MPVAAGLVAIYINTHTCAHTHTYSVYLCVCVCVCMCVCVCVNLYHDYSGGGWIGCRYAMLSFLNRVCAKWLEEALI